MKNNGSNVFPVALWVGMLSLERPVEPRIYNHEGSSTPSLHARLVRFLQHLEENVLRVA